MSVNASATSIRFGSRDFCAFNVTSNAGLTHYLETGCRYGGWSYNIAADQVGVYVPGPLASSLTKVATLLPVCEPRQCRPVNPVLIPVLTPAFTFILLALVHHAWTIRYTLKPAPNADKTYTLVQIHFVTAILNALYLLVVTIILFAVCGASTNDGSLKGRNVTVNFGQAPWLVLVATLFTLIWAYESIRWRNIVNSG